MMTLGTRNLVAILASYIEDKEGGLYCPSNKSSLYQWNSEKFLARIKWRERKMKKTLTKDLFIVSLLYLYLKHFFTYHIPFCCCDNSYSGLCQYTSIILIKSYFNIQGIDACQNRVGKCWCQAIWKGSKNNTLRLRQL